ncbi:GDP-mannose 4,6-dehydratase [Solicola sp. PLA-1-18]|uniref:GDP-mannose 4,6-dehydratase n=1 Tax=Solicola sp. PLA-1-18 TaxID=3380532 RepID=UPI003B8268D8
MADAPRRKAFVTGVSGQDGSYLAELLLGKGYEVHGLVRGSSGFNAARIDHLLQDPHDPDARMFLHYGDLTDGARLLTLLGRVRPDEVYNLGAQSNVRTSFDEPELTADVAALGTLRLLEAIRMGGFECRFLQASSAEMFGDTAPPQHEGSTIAPRSPHAIAKAYAYWTTRSYRETYGLHCSNAIMFNHESPRRGESFLTRKISRAVARIAAGVDDYVYLGALDPVRDWGYAPEYVEAMWAIQQHRAADDFVLATGQQFSVRDFAAAAFDHAGLDWEKHVRFDERYLRPSDPQALIGDASKAARELGWEARVQATALAAIMVDADADALQHEGKPWIDRPVGWGPL